MRRWRSLLALAAVCLPAGLAAMVIDHNCVDLATAPDRLLQKARQELKVTFAHGVDGSQILAGLQALKDANPVLYNFHTDNTSVGDSLSLWDQIPPGALGMPDMSAWAEQTEKFLNTVGRDRNVVIWAWSRRFNSISHGDLQKYFRLMSELEKKFPQVKFVYTTGPLDGRGENGDAAKRNEQIRRFCIDNNRILFDLADLESHSPTNRESFLKFNPLGDGSVTINGKKNNWADAWLRKYPAANLELPEKAPGSHPLIANLQARAFWWMLARMSGWNPPLRTADRSSADAKISPPSPVPRAAAPVAAGTGELKGQTLLYRFDKIQDYRYWVLSGSKGTLIPDKGTGMVTPKGKLSVAMYRNQLCVQELEFKVKIEQGAIVNWYINTKWDDRWNPKSGLGGVFSDQGCMLMVNGVTTPKFKSPFPADKNEHRFQIWIRNNKVGWAIDRKTVAEVEIPAALADQPGTLAIGGWDASVRIDGVFIRTR